jgi:hypothetical protein
MLDVKFIPIFIVLCLSDNNQLFKFAIQSSQFLCYAAQLLLSYHDVSLVHSSLAVAILFLIVVTSSEDFLIVSVSIIPLRGEKASFNEILTPI